MVYATHLWWFGGLFIIVLPTLYGMVSENDYDTMRMGIMV